MSRYGTVLGGTANAITAVIQSENADDMIPLIVAAVGPLLVGVVDPVATSLTLTGAGDGHMFFLELEGAASANVDGGARITNAQFFVAATAEALQAQLASMQFNQPIFDVQIAGSSKGQRVMAMVLFGTVQSSGGGMLVWRPDGAGDVTTWAEVMVRVAASKGPLTIYCPQDNSLTPIYAIPPGLSGPPTLYDMKGSRLVAPQGPHDNIRVTIQRNATLQNLAGISGGLRLQANKFSSPADPPALTFVPEVPGTTMVFVVDDGAELHNLPLATAPMLTVPDNTVMSEFYLVFNQLGTAQSESSTGDPVVYAPANSALNVTVLSGGLSIDTIQPAGWLGGDALAQVRWIHDGTMAFPNPPAPSFWDTSGAGYFPKLRSLLFNQPTGTGGGTGPRANRPRFQDGGPASLGCMYFATDYVVIAPNGSPIWWDGTNWRDTAGTIVP
jgi:hypothetical protein